MSALSILTRRLPVVAARSLTRSLTRTTTPILRVALSTNAQKINETLANKPGSGLNDTHMHDQFEMLEKMMEHDIHVDSVQELKAAMRRRPMAVDAPDGESDGHLAEEMQEIQSILDDVAAHKEEIKARLQKVAAAVKEAQRIYAVDSPDGETDGHIAEELEEIKHIIDDAAVHEDKKKIEYSHKMEDAVRKERARDPEHDW